MKKLFLTCSIFLAGICFGYSQAKSTAPVAGSSEKMVAKVKEVCNLSDDQVAKVKPMAETFAKTREANKQKYANDKEGMKTAMKSARETYIAQLKTVLTTEQVTKFQAYQKQQADKKKGGNKEE